MDGVVFAAGRGTRLRPLTDETPKPMLEVGGEPLVVRCLRRLVALGADRVIVVVGYRADVIRDHVGATFADVPVVYAHQDEPRGMAHALLAAAPSVTDDMLLIDGDNCFDCDLTPVVERHHEPDVDGVVLLERVSQNAAKSKAICHRDGDGTIRRIVNKPDEPPDPAFVASGFQTATPELIDACRRIEESPRGEYEMAAAIQRTIDDGRHVVGVELDGWHLNVNTPSDLERARMHFENRNQ